MDLTITQADLRGQTNYIVSSFYPTIKEICHFAFYDRKKINKDEFMVGIWKIKQLKK